MQQTMTTPSTTTTRKKRPRPTDSPDSDGEKRRGRPRVEKPDTSAGDPKDRRRLQIRMAQRAYRQRKESTLEELRKRVSELSNTIELMNKAFVECRDRLYASSLAADQLRDLQVVSTQFEGYLSDARNPGEEDLPASNAKNVDPVPQAAKVANTQVEAVGEATSVSEWLDQGAVAGVAKQRHAGAADVGMGYEMTYGNAQDHLKTTQHPLLLPKTEEFPSYQVATKPITLDTFEIPDMETPEGSLLRVASLSPPMTYSFQESTFARRLFRATLESAYHLLLDPSRRLADFERIFKLSLLGRDRAKILANMRRGLSKGLGDELDSWHAPLIHIGGAGTHYARRDIHGNLLPKKQTKYVGLIGPQKLALLENAMRDRISVDMTVEVAGFEGEWFDPHDVQGYLEEKGIFIDPASSFAEVDIFDRSPLSESSSSNSASYRPRTPEDQLLALGNTLPFNAGQSNGFGLGNSDLGQWNEMELGSVGFSDAQMGSWMNFVPPGQGIKEFQPTPSLDQSASWDTLMTGGFPQALDKAAFPSATTHLSRHSNRSMIIDVAKFIEVLVLSGVCLGRSPGFRRRDVDRALVISSFESS